MERLLAPRGVALVGASPDPGKLSGRPLDYLQRFGYAGGVYPVNPKYAEIDGTPCYPSVESVPDPVDLALILVPQGAVEDAVRACAARGIPYAIVIASGFAEAGNQDAQAALVAICRESGMRLIGPNCVGVVHPASGMAASFSTVLKQGMFLAGGLALVTQSGALGNSLLQSFQGVGVGIRTWVSTGNEADLGALEIVDALIDDPQTQAIALFLEGLKDGSRLVPIALRARQAGKPITVLRAGKSEAGRRASLSHTGKLAGALGAWRGAVSHGGLLEVATLEEMVDLCLALQVAPPRTMPDHPGLAVLTVSGGQGVLVTDRASELGIDLVAFGDATRERLRSILPAQASVANPVDTALFADDRSYMRCASIVLDDPNTQVLLLIVSSLAHHYSEISQPLVELAERARAAGKLVCVTYLSASDPLPGAASRALAAAGALVLPTPERALTAVARVVRAGRAVRGAPAPPPAPAPAPVSAPLPGRDLTDGDLLRKAGLPLVPEALCATRSAAVRAAADIGLPVAVKVASRDIAHKSDVGGVAIDLATYAAVARAHDRVLSAARAAEPGARIDGVTVQAMVHGGLELIVGCVVDPELGRVGMVGSGGVLAEVVRDSQFRCLPVGPDEILCMLRSLRLSALLEGYRGGPPLDVRAAVRAIQAAFDLFATQTWMRELDLNPLVVLPAGQGARVVDYLVVSD